MRLEQPTPTTGFEYCATIRGVEYVVWYCEEEETLLLENGSGLTEEERCCLFKQAAEMKIRQEESYRIATTKAIKSGYCIEFPKGEVYVPIQYLIGTAHAAVQWDAALSCWVVQTIPLERGAKSKFKLAPIGDEIFCHPAGFISKTKTGRFNLVEA